MRSASNAERVSVAWWGPWCGPIVVSTSFLVLTVWTWRKWPDLLADFGRELYIPWQLTLGKTLYTDIAYFNGPLSPYLNSLWFRLFGVSFTTLIIVNLVILALITALIYTIFRDACDRFTAIIVSITFLCIFSFGQYLPWGNYNFVSPYFHEMTHGIGFAVGMIFFFARYVRYRQLYLITLAGLCLGLVFLTKAEIFLAAAAAAATGLGLLEISGRSLGRRTGVASLAFAAGALVPIALFIAFLSVRMPAMQALRGVVGTWVPLLTSRVASNHFYQHSMGLSDPGSNLLRMAQISAGIVLLAGAVVAADIMRGLQKTRMTIAVLSVLLGVVALFAKQMLAPDLLTGQLLVPLLLIGPSLPLFSLAVAIAIITVYIRRRTESHIAVRLLPLTMWAVLSFVLLGKIILSSRLAHYGFALAMPATILLVALSVGLIPEVLRKLCGGGDLFRKVSVAMVLLDISFYLIGSHVFYSRKDYVVGSDNDAIITYGPQWDLAGSVVTRTLQRIQLLMPPAATFVVLPEGVMLNYLSRRSNPTPYINFMPPELTIFGEAVILESFKAYPPDFILLTHRPIAEDYGIEFFGADPGYGRQIMEWVESYYVTEERIEERIIGESGQPFGIKILRRRPQRQAG